jgi:uncharacterized protein YbgA (DUF1722 family)/uncharacterized protein YbbK (DUF523 family)
VDYVPVCPEVECGLPIPRESMHLEGDPESPRLVTSKTKRDMTERMVRWAMKRVVELEKEDLCGFIFKSDSPSSGMERIKVYNEKGMPVKKGAGMFARVFMEHFPLLPVEEDGRLHDSNLRENFIERIFTLKRWRETLKGKESRGNVVDFHTRHKLLILSHNPKHYQTIGNLVARAKELPTKELYQQYQTILMEALQLKTTPKKNANVLQHMMGYFREQLSPDEKQELLEVINHYKQEYIPLIVPITLIQHYVRKYDQPYLKQQVYLNPHPLELQLRNHV